MTSVAAAAAPIADAPAAAAAAPIRKASDLQRDVEEWQTTTRSPIWSYVSHVMRANAGGLSIGMESIVVMVDLVYLFLGRLYDATYQQLRASRTKAKAKRNRETTLLARHVYAAVRRVVPNKAELCDGMCRFAHGKVITFTTSLGADKKKKKPVAAAPTAAAAASVGRRTRRAKGDS